MYKKIIYKGILEYEYNIAWLSEYVLHNKHWFIWKKIYVAVSGVAPTGATGVSLQVDWSPERWPIFSASAFLWGSFDGVSLPVIFASAISAAIIVLSAIYITKKIF